jgi:hypothetical protein
MNPFQKLLLETSQLVRKAIYTNSSDADLFDGRFDIYKKINKGFWMIRKDINEHTLKEFLGNLHDENT